MISAQRFCMILALVSFLGFSFGLQQTATAQSYDQDGQVTTSEDPFEDFNRVVFEFNRGIDYILLKPVSQTYKYLLPEVVRLSIRNVLGYLGTPVTFAHELLQGDLDDATVVLKRFAINSTVGFFGFADAATDLGLPAPSLEDFGQTLARWGAEPGPYLVLPFAGPSNFRDAFGMAVDMFADPVNAWARHEDEDGVLIGRIALSTVDQRAQLLGTLDRIYEDSLDPYITIKSFYEQRRQSSIDDIVDTSHKNVTAVQDYDSYAALEN